MSEYILREARKSDIPFLATASIEAEKGMGDKCNYSTLFNIPELKLKEYLISMFEEEIEGCEFDYNNYFIIEYQGKPVASFGGWIETFNGTPPSAILKSNLINFTFPPESIEFLKSKQYIVKELSADRDPLVLHLEYLYIVKEHRGHHLADKLIVGLEERAIRQCPLLKKSHIQLYDNNVIALKLYERHGYKPVKIIKASHPEILDYLPSDTKLVLEKNFV
jgi:ribosomal protein S18 acetylase RimI-like enzyme